MCCIEGCGEPVRCKSMCALHYERMRRTGRPDDPKPPPVKPCDAQGCERNAWALGYCQAHHQRLKTHGDPLAHIPLKKLPRAAERDDIRARILAQTITTPRGCIQWTGTVDPGGYGSISWNRRSWRIHRAMWTAVVGKIPSGDWTLDHLCYNRRRVNIGHLELVTRAENTMRAMLRKYAGADHLPEPVLDFLRAASRGTLDGRDFFDQWTGGAAG